MNKEQTETPENADGESPVNITEDRQESNEVVDDNDSGVDENVENVENVDVAALESQLNDAKDQYLRAKAEMDHIRRRSDKQVSDSRKFDVENFAKELLGVRDSLQLAAEVEIEAEDSDAVKSKLSRTPNNSLAKFSTANLRLSLTCLSERRRI